jgi:hypothetical protein
MMKHHRRLGALLAVATMTLTAVVASSAIAEEEPEGPVPDQVMDGVRLVTSPDFIGVVDSVQNVDVASSSGVTITWSGSRSGSVRVIWSSVPTDSGGGLAAEHVGRVTPSELAALRAELESVIGPRTQDSSVASTGPVLVCSLNVPNPYWDDMTDSASAGVFQACTGDLVEQRVKGELQMKKWWIFYSTKARGDSGWSVSDNVATSMSKECESADRKDWRNKGQGMARSSTRLFVTPWYTTDPVPLWCKA